MSLSAIDSEVTRDLAIRFGILRTVEQETARDRREAEEYGRRIAANVLATASEEGYL